MALSMYEFAPLWYALFRRARLRGAFLGLSTRRTYDKGQYTIPSDTICYPAKLMHGHIQELIDKGLETIFYPSLTYNVDEGAGDNHYNCPVVAYYGEVPNANISGLRDRRFLYPYLSLESPKTLGKTLYRCLKEFDALSRKEVMRRTGFEAYDLQAGAEGRGPEIAGLVPVGKAGTSWCWRDVRIMRTQRSTTGSTSSRILSATSCSARTACAIWFRPARPAFRSGTFHTRMYRAARFAVKHNNTQLVQLVSFGCGIDAITGMR